MNYPPVFHLNHWAHWRREGGELIASTKGLYPALCSLQEIELGNMKPQLEFATQFRSIIPDQFPWIEHALSVGVVAKYTGGVPVCPRTRGLPYQCTNEEHCHLIGEKFWKDILTKRMFVCTTRTVGPNTPVEATPTTLVDKKNPDRTISGDKRLIADLRRVNLSFPTDQFYNVSVPSISEISHDIIRLQARNPGIPVALTKRDIAPAFRLLRLHPALCLVMATELPGKMFGLTAETDIALLYLATPFGWNGSPAHFAVFGDALTIIHCSHGVSNPEWYGAHPFRSKLYVDDGIFTELLRTHRMRACTESRGDLL